MIAGSTKRVCVSHWIREERERSGFRYQYSTYQFEYSRNSDLARESSDGTVCGGIGGPQSDPDECKAAENDSGPEEPSPQKEEVCSGLAITIERPSYDLTIFKVYCGKMALKIYTKGERVFRAEAMAQNAEALKCGRLVEKFAMVGAATKERYWNASLKLLSCMDRCFISDGTLDQLPAPSDRG